MTAPKWIMLGAFSVFSFVYPFAILLLSFDWMPFGMEWMSSLLLAMLGITAGAWLWVNFSMRGLLLAVAIFIIGLVIEYTGVNTGLPFGAYSYTGVLIPEVAGGVPVAIGFAWLLTVVGGLFTAKRALRTSTLWVTCALGAALVVGLDFLLEPVAYHVKGYWHWHEGGGYYGVPWSNFIAWFAISLLLNTLMSQALDLKGRLSWAWVPVAIYVMNVVMFGIVNLTHGFWWSGAIGLLLLSGLWLMRRAPSKHHAL
jgi:putative membrane protein